MSLRERFAEYLRRQRQRDPSDPYGPPLPSTGHQPRRIPYTRNGLLNDFLRLNYGPFSGAGMHFVKFGPHVIECRGFKDFEWIPFYLKTGVV